MNASNEGDDQDSAIGGSAASSRSSLTSLPSAIAKHVEELGRTYNAYKNGKYNMPNDEREQDRLDFHHSNRMCLFNGKLAFAPIDTIPLHNVLDIATGTGIWAIEFAEAYPSASVIGTDLSPIQPSAVPVNCSFEVDDAEEEWIFGHKFDYIHLRDVWICFQDLRHIIRSAFDSLTPGGYLEFQDPVMPISYAEPPPENSAFVKWTNLFIEGAERTGRSACRTKYLAGWMRDTGFVDIAEHKMVLPMGPWPKDEDAQKLGVCNMLSLMDGIESATPRVLAYSDWTKEEANVLVAQLKNELRRGAVKPYYYVLAVWGRKPAA